MSFFKEFKDDLSQAVNELVSEDEKIKKEVVSNTEYEEMVNTLDDSPIIASSNEDLSEEKDLVMQEPEEIDDISDYLEKAIANSNESSVMNEEPIFAEVPVIQEEKEEVSDVQENTNMKSLSDEKTVITKGTIIEGNISSEGSIDLEGRIKGNVSCLGKLVISGEIVGASKAAEIYTNSTKICGDVTSDGSIKVGNGSVIIGNVYATSAVIGGAIKGDIDVKGPVILDGTSVVQGNIKSRSVQINNGAVIDGMVSQCYADIDYKTLFDETFSK